MEFDSTEDLFLCDMTVLIWGRKLKKNVSAKKNWFKTLLSKSVKEIKRGNSWEELNKFDEYILPQYWSLCE